MDEETAGGSLTSAGGEEKGIMKKKCHRDDSSIADTITTIVIGGSLATAENESDGKSTGEDQAFAGTVKTRETDDVGGILDPADDGRRTMTYPDGTTEPIESGMAFVAARATQRREYKTGAGGDLASAGASKLSENKRQN